MNRDDYELMQQMFTRMCHDLSGVCGAALNGMEMMRESLNSGDDPLPALDLAERAGQAAAARIKFFRAVMGREGPLTKGSDARDLAAAYIQTLDNDAAKFALEWNYESPVYDRLRLAMLASHSAVGFLIRGGVITVSGDGEDVIVTAAGQVLKVDEETKKIFEGSDAKLDPKNAPIKAMIGIAALAGGKVSLTTNEGKTTILMRF